jgi:hypothetical protein
VLTAVILLAFSIRVFAQPNAGPSLGIECSNVFQDVASSTPDSSGFFDILRSTEFQLARWKNPVLSLAALGYTPEIAERMLAQRPDIALKILKLGHKEKNHAEAKTLYRGIAVSIVEFINTTHASLTFPKKMFFDDGANDFIIPRLYASKKITPTSKPFIIQIQVPVFLLHRDRSRLGVYLTKNEVPDILPFIQNVGEFLPDGSIKWIGFTEFSKRRAQYFQELQ